MKLELFGVVAESDVVEALPLLIVVFVYLIARRLRRRVPDWGDVSGDAGLAPDADGALIVPVSQLMHRRLWGGTTNGLSPQLWITEAGLRFKVFQPSERRFIDFKRIDARKSLFDSTRLIFHGHRETLHVTIRRRAVARQVLRVLAPEIPLTPAAAALRGD